MSQTLDPFSSTGPDLRPRAGISWAAVLGGAAVATAVSAALLTAGAGLGLASVSPLASSNPSVTTFTVLAAIWLIVTQWLSSFFGGYLAGRLRPASGSAHRDEVMFRDTASGFVTWAVSSVVIVGLAGSSASALIGGVSHTAASMTSGTPSASSPAAAPAHYLLDRMFRPAQPGSQGNAADAKAEAARILSASPVSQEDHDYLVQLVSARSGVPQDEATKRVDQAVGDEHKAVVEAKKVADDTRKAAAGFALYSAFSMLVGAFIACVAGAVGGRKRDTY